MDTAPDYPQFVRMWLDFLSKMASAGAIPAPDPLPMDATREMRDAYLQALNRNTEQFLRSPQFLEMMRQSTELTVAMRQQFNEFLAQAHQATGSVSRGDVDSLLMAVRRCESRILDKLDEISARVDQLDEQVRASELEDAKPAHARKGK